MLIGTLIAHHAHTADGGEQNDASLPDLIVKSPLTQGSDINIVGILKDAYLFRGNIAQDTDGETWPWERMTGNQMLWHTQLTAYTTHLVLEQPFQWLTELQVHLLR